jgi:hypothetical protein
MKTNITNKRITKFIVLFIVIVCTPILLHLLSIPNLPGYEWDLNLPYSAYIIAISFIGIILFFRKDLKEIRLRGLNFGGAHFELKTPEEIRDIQHNDDIIKSGQTNEKYPNDVLYDSITSFIRSETDKFKFYLISLCGYELIKDIEWDEKFLKWSFEIFKSKKIYTIDIRFNTYHNIGVSWCIYVNGSVCSQANQLPTFEMMKPMFKVALDNLPAFEEMMCKLQQHN